jgi:hypothetical protein
MGRPATEGEQLLYDKLHTALDALNDRKLDLVENDLLDALDLIVGFCRKDLRVFVDEIDFRGTE